MNTPINPETIRAAGIGAAIGAAWPVAAVLVSLLIQWGGQ